tara:strand:- start:106 stop:723 length:618 start_codon:yes stop_codon:yes gene_type:complete
MIIALLLIAYFLGSLAWSVWIGRWMFGIDLREHGSGNAGATNAFRVLGKQAGTLVLFLDVLKGFAAVKLIHFLPADQQSVIAMLGLGFLAVFGHLFPIYVGFRGGKGIATLLGVVIALHSGAALLAMGVFVAFLLATRIVSVSSMAAALSLPLWLIYRFKEPSEVLIIFSFAIALLVLITHRKNIVRLLRGEENKVKLKRKRAED